jgi:hypothetical protein
MDDSERPWIEILGIGREVSIRGSGSALRDALIRTRYREHRSSLQEEKLLPLVTAHPTLVGEWLAYSEDKRTSRGWYLLASGEIGRVGAPESRKQFASIEEAVTAYVIRELDSWAGSAV